MTPSQAIELIRQDYFAWGEQLKRSRGNTPRPRLLDLIVRLDEAYDTVERLESELNAALDNRQS